MSVKVCRPHHDRCSLRTCESRNGRRLLGARPILPYGRDSRGSRHKHARPATITVLPVAAGASSRARSRACDPDARA